MPRDWDTGLEKRGRSNGQLVPDSCLRLKAMGAGMYGTVRHFSLLKNMRKINPFSIRFPERRGRIFPGLFCADPKNSDTMTGGIDDGKGFRKPTAGRETR
jgi:hypothetical protein